MLPPTQSSPLTPLTPCHRCAPGCVPRRAEPVTRLTPCHRCALRLCPAAGRAGNFSDPVSPLCPQAVSRGGPPEPGFISDLKAGDLLGRSNEELVLLLIQLRRQSTAIAAGQDRVRQQLNSAVSSATQRQLKIIVSLLNTGSTQRWISPSR